MLRLTNRHGFRWWLGGATLSTLGDSVTFFALGWVAASHGPGLASLVLTVESVPLCVLILFGGALADRWGTRRVMIGCDVFMAVVMAAFALGALIAVPVWSLLLVALLSGTAAALRRPAAGVFPRLFATGDDELSRTLATTTLFQQLAQIAGPSVGGVLLGVGGLPVTSVVDAASFLVVLSILMIVRPPHEPAPSPSRPRLWRQLREAQTAARHAPGVLATIVTVSGLAVTILPLVSLCVPLVGHTRGWSAGGTGLVSAAWVGGSLLVMTLVARRGMPGPRTAVAGPAVAALGVLLLGAIDDYRAAAAGLGLVGVGTSLLTARIFPRFMDATPPDLLARFYALLGLAQTAPMLVATPMLGRLIGGYGIQAALAALAAILLLTPVAARRAEQQLTSPEPGWLPR